MAPISDTEIIRIMQGLDIISRLGASVWSGVADAFRHDVPYKKLKQYMKDIAYPVDLQLIRTRRCAVVGGSRYSVCLPRTVLNSNDPASEIAK